MGWTVLYIAFGVVALWLLGEVLLQYKARLRWRVLAFLGFTTVVIGVVVLSSVVVIALGAITFAVGQTFVTLSYRRGFSTGWALGGKPGASRRRRAGADTGPEAAPSLEVSELEEHTPEPDVQPWDEEDFDAFGAGHTTPTPVVLPEEWTAPGYEDHDARDSGQYPAATTGWGSPDAQPSYAQASYDPGAYDPYGQSSYDQGGYAQDPYTQHPQAQDPYAQTSYAQDPYTPSSPYDTGAHATTSWDTGGYAAGHPQTVHPEGGGAWDGTPASGVWVPQQRDTGPHPGWGDPGQDEHPAGYGYPPQQNTY